MLTSSHDRIRGLVDCECQGPFGSGGLAVMPSWRRSPGFTLLALVIVMTIMVTLAGVGGVNYQGIREEAKETLLKDDLKTMRKMNDQDRADKESLPKSL